MPEGLRAIFLLVGIALLCGAAASGGVLFISVVAADRRTERTGNLWGLFLFCLAAGLLVTGVAFIE